MKHRLSLAYQGVTSPPSDVISRYGVSITEMDLSYNKVTDLKFLQEMPVLESLVLDHNLITSQVKIALCPTLETLWVNHNRIENLGWFIATLAKSCPNLRILSMMNNIAAPSYFNGGTYQQFLDYRYFVISSMPKIEVLDDRPITSDERSEALRLYPLPLVKAKRSGKAAATTTTTKRKKKTKSDAASSASSSSSSSTASASASVPVSVELTESTETTNSSGLGALDLPEVD